MVEIIPFGKYQGKSVEQVALEDPGYFVGHLCRIPIIKRSLDNRLKFVNYVANMFVSQKKCNGEGCENPAEKITIYHNLNMGVRQSDLGFVYCSPECFNEDSKADHGPKVQLCNLGLTSCVSHSKGDSQRLMEIIAECMGLKSGRKTKEYLYDFFNDCPLRIAYPGPKN